MAVNHLAHKTALSIYIGLVLANVAVTLRFIARWVGRLKITIDDYLMLLALLSYWGMGIGGLYVASKNGFRLPLAETPPLAFVMFMKLVYAETFLYTATVTFTKLSILAMYRRVLPSQWTYRNVYVCGCLVILWAITISIANSLACLPVQSIWNFSIKGKCLDWAAFYYGIQIPNIVTDIYIVVIPLREVFSLRLTKVQKGILVGIFGIATLTIIFDIIRLVAMLEFASSKEDFTISIVEPTVWTCVEPAVGIFAACLSNLRPLFRYVSKHARCFRPAKPQEMVNREHNMLPKIVAMVQSKGTTSTSTTDDIKMESMVGTMETGDSKTLCGSSY